MTLGEANVPNAGWPDRSKQPLRALIVEDSPGDVKLMVIALERAGYLVTYDVVESVALFQKRLSETQYDLILSDHHLPNWNGFEALKILRASNKDIPFIVVTGALGDEAAVEYMKSGACGYVLKQRLARLPLAVKQALREKVQRVEMAILEEARARLASIVEFSDDAIIARSLDGTIFSWNRGAERIYGYSPQEAIGQPISLIAPPDCQLDWPSIVEKFQRGERIEDHTATRLRKDGTKIDISISVSPLKDATGRVTGASILARDITRQKELEARLFLARTMEAIERLAGGMAHEFTDLLRVVAGLSDLVLESLESESLLRRRIEQIRQAAESGISATRDLLALSGQQTLEPQLLCLNDVVSGMTRTLRQLLGEDIEIRTLLNQPLGFVKADPSQLEQVVMNHCTHPFLVNRTVTLMALRRVQGKGFLLRC